MVRTLVNGAYFSRIILEMYPMKYWVEANPPPPPTNQPGHSWDMTGAEYKLECSLHHTLTEAYTLSMQNTTQEILQQVVQ